MRLRVSEIVVLRDIYFHYDKDDLLEITARLLRL
jgi:hypothetical protein